MVSRDLPPDVSPKGTLRILETTDLHMHVLGYDYFADRPDSAIGLCGLADLIAAQRSKDDATTLLFDNGDFLQGNPLADHVFSSQSEQDIHPMAAAMKLLRYNAITLGNHDLDYGLPFLRRTLEQIGCATVSANIEVPDASAIAAPFVILPTVIKCSDGKQRTINVGVTGFGPPQMADWGITQTVQVNDIIEAAKACIPKIKAAGADIIIVLCHSGIGAEKHSPRMENAALPLAEMADIDVILAGHTHEFFPNAVRPPSAAIDPIRGRLHDKPAVFAGFYGRALGVVDLDVQWSGDGWAVCDADVSLVRPDKSVPISKERRQIEAVTKPYHDGTLTDIRTPIARMTTPFHSFFATVVPDLSQQLLANAMREKLSATMAHDVPVLAAVAPFRFGGTVGPTSYIDVPAGFLTMKDAVAIFPFADRLCAVRRTGFQLRQWLERSAAHYNQITPGRRHQELLNPLSPGYNCDAIYGLTYQIDLSKPAHFDLEGNVIHPDAQRISNLAIDGVPVQDDDLFVVAANSFRVKGGGNFVAVDTDDILWTSNNALQEIFIAYLANLPATAVLLDSVWRFQNSPETAAQFSSAPAAIPHAHGPIYHDGQADDGAEMFSLWF